MKFVMETIEDIFIWLLVFMAAIVIWSTGMLDAEVSETSLSETSLKE